MRKTWLWTAFILIAIAAGSYGLYWYLTPRPLPEGLLYGNGHAEATEIRVASELGGRIIDSRLREGAEIAAGDLLVRLDATDLILRKQRAEAELEALERQREQLMRELEVGRHHLQTAETELARNRTLAERGTVSPQQFDSVKNAYEEARGRVDVQDATVRATDARLQAAEKEVALIAHNLTKTQVQAPISGRIIAKAVEQGEVVGPGQLVAIVADLSRIELTVYVPEKDIGKIRLDAPAKVRVDAFPDRQFAARVARIDETAQFTPRDIHMPEERVRMVFGVTLKIANPEGLLKPGMPADAWILLRPDGEWPSRLWVPQ